MNENRVLFDELNGLSTEGRNLRTMDIDTMTTSQILNVLNAEDKKVAFAVERELPYISAAVEIILDALKKGGRLFYVGAGTSGRIGVQDATECPPTFGSDPEKIQGLMAGGKPALFKAQEGIEDHEENGSNDIMAHGVNCSDVVCGLAASRRTPYVIGAVTMARQLGAKTIFITTNPRSDFHLDIDVAICPETGTEAIMGSTRMKSGTAQKLILNMISTAVMIRLGKIYENMMVDLQMTNRKLEERSKRTVMTVTGVTYEEAERTLTQASGQVKTAIVMIQANVNAGQAHKRLEAAHGFVRQAIGKKIGNRKTS